MKISKNDELTGKCLNLEHINNKLKEEIKNHEKTICDLKEAFDSLHKENKTTIANNYSKILEIVRNENTIKTLKVTIDRMLGTIKDLMGQI